MGGYRQAVSLNCYSSIPKWKHICKKLDNNNFYHTNKFFHVVIETMVMMLYMHVISCSTIDNLQTWVGRSNWLALINKIKYDYLKIFTIQHIRNETSTKTTTTIATMLGMEKKKWLELNDHQ